MITFGLTGGIACGKSTVTKTFNRHNIPMVDADLVARQVVEPGTYTLHLIGFELGMDLILSKGILDRKALGKLVFSDKEAMRLLNEIMLPAVHRESQIQIEKLHSEGNLIVGYDAALIIEHGHIDNYKPLIVVSCPIEMQLARLMKRNSFSHDEAMSRINSQMPVEEKIKLADYIIDTSGTIEESIAQTENIIVKLKDLL